MATPHSGKFVGYYRVSTAKQGKSGLGREAQEATVQAYLNGGRWKLTAEFTEVESGRRSDRPQLAAALAACRLHRAKLVVAKVDGIGSREGRGVKLGGVRNLMIAEDVRELGRKAIQKRAADKAADYAPVIRKLQAAGTRSLRGIAAGLNERGIPTPSGRGAWQAIQVQRVLARLA
jgi:hypothetical protein